MDFVNRLKFFMESAKISISQFADTCSIPRPTMSQILNGRNKKISDELISKIHAAYPNLSVLWLMFGEGEMEINSNTQISEAQNSPGPEHEQPYIPDSQPFANGDAGIFRSAFQTSENSEPSPDGIFRQNPTETTHQYPVNSPAPLHPAPDLFDNNNFIDFGTDNQQESRSHIGAGKEITEVINPENIFTASPAKENSTPAATPAPEIDSSASGCKTITLPTSSHKTITNIVVFYSDNSFQSFSPSTI